MAAARRVTTFRPSGGGRHSRLRSLTAAFSSFLLVAGLLIVVAPQATAAAAAACTGNEIVCENQLPGTDPSIWDVEEAGDESIQGFATQMSVNRGNAIQFKIQTTASAYSIDIYRLGYYGGLGARKVATINPSATLPQIQPACATDPETEIYDCGTWAVSASWAVPSSAVSGVYIARLNRPDNNDSSHIPFIVRNDASTSQVVFQTSDSTWQAYNTYGGSSFYQGIQNGRAFKLSYNRPFATRNGVTARDYLFSNEYPMIRFLESNGYDMSYISSLDTDISGSGRNGNGTNLLNHKTFLSVGHDEYWSENQRTNVENARDAGVNLAFFSGNEVYWKTRWEPSEDGNNTADRTLVCYKDTWADTQIDPVESTSTWRDPRFGVGQPENALTGTAYMSNDTDLPITVNAEEGKLRLWRNTTLANQAAGTSTALAAHTVGYESDEDLDNGFRPAGLVRLSTTTGPAPQYLQDFGSVTAAGTTTHHLTMYRAGSGALVFGAGTIQWAWGLDTHHDGVVVPVDTRIQQATLNILADMGATATTLTTQGVVQASKSTDTTKPSAVITSPTAGTMTQGAAVTVTGTATDVGGAVAGVEVSLDGGTSWHPATGRNSFTYTGVVTGTGSSVVLARAIDDSGNIQAPAAAIPVAANCPCSIFGAEDPKTPAASDSSSLTLGTKFTSSADGFITGLRFYKGAGNTGTHTGTLYKADGTVLSTATFANETATGWQTVNLPSAVPITANTTYIASYTAPNGHYSADAQYFAYSGKTSNTLTALGSYSNLNGVFTTGQGIPGDSYRQTNYFVDAVYSPTDTTPITVTTTNPLDGSTSVNKSTTLTANYSRSAIPSSVTFTVKDSAGNDVAGVASYDDSQRMSTFDPTADLSSGTKYTATISASSAGVGAMAAPFQFSFTTALDDAVPGVCPCSLFNDGDAPVVIAANDSGNVELGVAFSADTDGQITGVRFYKGPGNTGAHTVSLWNSAGTQLATASVSAESTTGWQTANFTAPVAVTAGTTYTASYRAPVGRYSYTSDGLRNPVDKAPLHTSNNASRYTYGSGAPTSGSSANYFVDPVFTVAAGAAPVVTAVSPANQSTSVPTSTTVGVTFDKSIQPGTASISVTDSAGAPVAGTMATLPMGPKASFTPSASLIQGAMYTVTVTGAKNLGGTSMAAPSVTTFITSGQAVCPCSLLSSSATPPTADAGDTSSITVGLKFKSDVDGVITGIRYYRDAANTGVHTGTLYTATGSVLATLTFPTTAPGWQTASFSTPVAVTAGTEYIATTFMPAGHYSAASNFFASPVVNSPLTGTLGTYNYGASASFPTSSYNNSYYFVDVSFVPVTAPAAPPGVVATKGDESATISWTAPYNGGKPISSYRVTPYVGGAAQTPTIVSGTTPATTATVAGLINGTEYAFTVVAVNSVGAGPASALSNAVTPGVLPTAPVNVTAVADDSSATVTWGAPGSDGGSAITSYVITPYIGSDPQQATVVSGNPPATTETITGLTPGTSYSFRVAAANASGVGSPAASAAVTVCPCTLLPSTATPAIADSGDGDAVSVGLRFTASESGFITGLRYYRATSNSGSHTGTLWTSDGTALASLNYPDTDPGWQTATFATPVPVVAGTTYVASTFMPVGHYSIASYFFAAPVVNGPVTGTLGTFTYGSDTFPSSSFASSHYFVDVIFSHQATTTVSTVPSVPTDVTVVAGNQSATVSWTAPNNGGSPITGYTVTPYIGTIAQPSVSVSGSPASTSTTVGGLVNGTVYTFTVSARNAVGAGSASAQSVSVTPAAPVTAPDAPGGVTATAGNATATVTWTAPSDGGSAITGYSVIPYIAGAAQAAVPASGTSAVLSGLTNGTAYTFAVTATNAIGTSQASAQTTAVTPATLPAAPTGVTAVRGNASAVVSWTAPANGGSTVTSYVVTPYIGATAQPTTSVTGNPAGTSSTVTGLTNGSAYTFTVTAVNGVGSGPASAVSPSVTPLTTPGAPTAVAATPGNTSASVSWTAPASNGGAAISTYTVTPYVGTTAQTARTVAGNPPATSLNVTGLTNGTEYTFVVTANNTVGAGAVSTPTTAVTPALPTAPAAPTGVTAVPGNVSATVSWTAPANGGSAITSYRITPYVGAAAQTVRTVSASATTLIVTGLTNGTAYTFRVAAVNAIGTSALSTASAAVTPATLPGAPRNISASAGNASATVSWVAPTSNGGSAITGYTITPYLGATAQPPTTVSGTSATINGLTNGAVYTFRVAAVNAIGAGTTANSGTVTPSGVPEAPTNVTGMAGDRAVSVSWAAPTSNGGSAITGYTVIRYVNGVSQGTTTSAGTATSIVVSNLTNGTTYTFAVTANNTRGNSPASAQSAGVKPFTMFVQGLGARSASAVTSFTATPASILTAGNRLVVMVGVKGSTTTTAQAVTDAAGNTYTKVAQFRGTGSSATTEMSIWTAPITAGAGTRPVVTARSNAAATLALTVTEYSGLSTAAGLAAIDQQRTASGSTFSSGTAQSGATGATTAPGGLAIGFYLDGGPSRTVSAGAGFTARVTGSGNSSIEYYLEDQMLGASGTTANASFAISQFFTTMPWLAATVVFKRQ